jgi:hypothetical protein
MCAGGHGCVGACVGACVRVDGRAGGRRVPRTGECTTPWNIGSNMHAVMMYKNTPHR